MIYMVSVIVLMIVMVLALWSVTTKHLLRSAIGLAAVSAGTAMLVYLFGQPLAGVFELSVCAGFITVIFISAMSLSRKYTDEENIEYEKQHTARFIPLAPIIIVVFFVLYFWCPWSTLITNLPSLPNMTSDVRRYLWDMRRYDILGQVAIILVGVIGIVVLFKQTKQRGE